MHSVLPTDKATGVETLVACGEGARVTSWPADVRLVTDSTPAR